MAEVNKKYYITKTYDYYTHNPDGELQYEQINKKCKTGERIIPMANHKSKFKMNVYNVNKCLFVEDTPIAEWYKDYKNSIETIGYTKGVFGEDRENRIIYCKDKEDDVGNYYKMVHEVDSGKAYNDQMWAIINEEGFLWEPTQIYNYYFPELDECNKPTGRYFVRSMDINPMSLTYTQIKIVEVKITEGIIRTEKDGEHPDKYINVDYNGIDTTLMRTE